MTVKIETTLQPLHPRAPRYSNVETRARAVEAVRHTVRTASGVLHVDAMVAVSVLLAYWPGLERDWTRHWTVDAIRLVEGRVREACNRWIEDNNRLSHMGPDRIRAEAAEVVVETVDRMLAPLDTNVDFASVVVLCGPRLRRLWMRPDVDRYIAVAEWEHAKPTEAVLHRRTPEALADLADRLMPRTEKNSHVARIVHPPDWPHAAAVRRNWPSITGLMKSAVRVLGSESGSVGSAVVMDFHRRDCQRCGRERSVWSPPIYTPRRRQDDRPDDFGPCPRCDKWRPPPVIGTLDSPCDGWSAEGLHVGEGPIAWHDLSDRSVVEIAAFLAHAHAAEERNLAFAITEAAYRNMLPTADELRVAWDLALEVGRVQSGDQDRLTLPEVWALCIPLLWGGYTRPDRGMPEVADA